MPATFNPNAAFMYCIVAVVIVFVIAESVFFFVRAWKRAAALNMDRRRLKKIVASTALYTIAPAVAILLGVIALSKALGLPLPWLRLSVIGALTYETTAAETAARAFGANISQIITDARTYAGISWVMTLGIMPSIVLLPIIGKRVEKGLVRLKSKDEKWGEIFMSALFLGMISAFLGVVFATIREGLIGWVPVFVMIASALIMLVCGLLVKKFKARRLQDFALPISMLGAMALSIPITRLVESIIGG